MPEKNDIVTDVCKRCVIGGISVFKRDERGAQVMRERNGGVVTGRVRSVSSRSGQALCWPSVADVPLQALKSAAALVLCLCAGGSKQLAHDEWGGLLSCLKRHFLRPENGAELPRQFQPRHNLVCDQRLSTVEPGSQDPVFVEIGGTRQSGLGTEGVRLLWSRHHRCCHQARVHG